MTTPSDIKELANATPDPESNRVTVIYADYGKRKTTTACSMVNERGLLLCSDDSWKVLLNTRHKELRDKVDIRKLTGLSQFDYLELKGYDTVIWDTVSRSVADFVSLLLKHAKWSGNNREKLITTHKELKKIENVGISDYRITRDSFEPIFDKIFKLDSHIIFTSQMTEPFPGLSKDQRFRPMLPAATFQIIAERADLIVNLRSESSKFVADMSELTPTLLAKSRIEGLQGKMNLDAFINTYKEIVFK